MTNKGTFFDDSQNSSKKVILHIKDLAQFAIVFTLILDIEKFSFGKSIKRTILSLKIGPLAIKLNTYSCKVSTGNFCSIWSIDVNGFGG